MSFLDELKNHLTELGQYYDKSTAKKDVSKLKKAIGNIVPNIPSVKNGKLQGAMPDMTDMAFGMTAGLKTSAIDDLLKYVGKHGFEKLSPKMKNLYAQHAHDVGVSELGLPVGHTAADRAQALGYDTPAYHATQAPNIKAFDPNISRPNGIRSGYRGTISTSTDPRFANQWAKELGDDANVMPLLVKGGKAYDPNNKIDLQRAIEQIGLSKSADPKTVKRLVSDWGSVENPDILGKPFFKKYGYSGGYGVEREAKNFITHDPASIRSKFAYFHPKMKNSGNILAGGLIPLLLGKQYYNQQQGGM
jgi:hypothetical protein